MNFLVVGTLRVDTLAVRGSMSSFEHWTLYLQAAAILASIILAVLAIFGETIRSWVYKPKLHLVVGTGRDLIESIPFQQDSSLPPTIVEKRIYIKLDNQGLGEARNCRVTAGEVWKSKSGGSDYDRSNRFMERAFLWVDQKSEANLPPKRWKHLRFISIVDQSSSKEGTPVENRSICYLFPPDRSSTNEGYQISLEEGTFAIPIRCCADNLAKALEYTIKLSWNGKSLIDSEASLKIEKLSSEESNRILKGAS